MRWNVELAILAALLGVGLLLNPVYLYPDGGGETSQTYEFAEIDDEEAAIHALSRSDAVLQCPGERACKLERDVLEAGSVEYEASMRRGQRYDVVAMDDELYLPVDEYDDTGTTTLSLEPLEPREAIEHVAVDAADRPPAVAEGVETGSVTLVGDELESSDRGEILAHDGGYYYVTDYSTRSHWTGDYGLFVARLALFTAGGSALLVAAALLRRDARSAPDAGQ